LFRDYHLNARDPFALSRPPEQRRIFEGNLTGPLGRSKKASFLISANREEEDAQATLVAAGPARDIRETVPTPQRNTELSGSINRQIGDKHVISIRGVYTDRPVRNQGVGGQPYTVTTGRDDNRDGLANDRPAGVRRNSLQGPGYADLDLRWSRDFFLVSSKKDKGPTVTLGLETFNVLNRVNYVSFIGNLSSPFFGQAIAAQPPRRLQVSFRFRF
jgi:hypothetical protein